MKFGKDEIQKLVLGGLLLIGVVYSYFTLLLGPLKARQEATRKSIEALAPEIKNAQAQIRRADDLRRAAPPQTKVIKQVTAMIPDGSPVAWFPTRISDFFKRQGIEKVSTRLNSETLDKELSGFRRMAWGLDLPKVDFAEFGAAVCALENEEPLIEIGNLQLDASREDAEAQHALITLNNIVKQ